LGSAGDHAQVAGVHCRLILYCLCVRETKEGGLTSLQSSSTTSRACARAHPSSPPAPPSPPACRTDSSCKYSSSSLPASASTTKRSYCVAIPNSISSSLGRRDASRASTICDAIRLEHDRSRSTSIDTSTLRTCMAASSPSSSSRMYSVASYAKGCEGCLHDASESACCLGKIDLVTCDHSPA